SYIRHNAPNVEIMADVSTLEEAQYADTLGFDYIGTTLRGYTSYTKGHILYENNFQFLKDVLTHVNAKVIAEGNVVTPEMFKQVTNLNVHYTVVARTITPPKQTTKRFIQAIEKYTLKACIQAHLKKVAI